MGKSKRIIWATLWLGLVAFLTLSFVSYAPDDISFLTSHPHRSYRNYGGVVGAYTVWVLLFTVGWAAYVLPVLALFSAFGNIVGIRLLNGVSKVIASLFSVASVAAIASVLTASYAASSMSSGGMVGFFIAVHAVRYLGEAGSLVVLSTILVLSLLVATEFMIVPVLLVIPRQAAALFRIAVATVWRGITRRINVLAPRPVRGERTAAAAAGNRRPERVSRLKATAAAAESGLPPVNQGERPVIKKAKPARKIAIPPGKATARAVGDYTLPPLELLVDPPPFVDRIRPEDLEANSRLLEETLRDFGIEVKVVEVEQGPVITRYELQPAPGIKITRIMGLGDDIALTMKAPNVHIVAPIPGKGTIGIDVPNAQATKVYFKDLLESPDFQQAKSRLSLALGKDISGNPLITDLAEMPHLLIAGTTGAGKTVCVNTLIMSLLYQAGPEEVKLILVDPKMVEMSMYNGLPHLICPVVTNVKKAAAALDWAVNEMDDRYRLLNKAGCRNITAYNKKVQEGALNNGAGEEATALTHLPYIVIIIDELADMMLIVGKEVETSIIRLAQKSRAVGIHMILATQRPSVDVITGIIKANFPARISFRVASKIDSRTVLDMNGADKLLGKGDMLFLKPGNFKLIRAQSSLISDKEIEDVVAFVRGQRNAEFIDELLHEQEQALTMGTELKESTADDELFAEAAKLVITTRQASVSLLQRRLRLGYARAARLIDMMEERGIVGAFRGSKAREILVDHWEEDVADVAANRGGD